MNTHEAAVARESLNAKQAGSTRESALLSFAIGLAVLVMVPLVWNLTVGIWSEGAVADGGRIKVELAITAATIATGLVYLISATSIFLAGRAIWLATRQGLSLGTPAVSLLVNIVGVLLWSMVSMNLFAVLEYIEKVS